MLYMPIYTPTITTCTTMRHKISINCTSCSTYSLYMPISKRPSATQL